MTAPTDAPVEERHRRAAADALERFPSPSVERWFATGSFAEASPFLASVVRYELTKVSQALANAERDGRASRDAEVAELSAYRMAWKRMRDSLFNLRNDALDRILAEAKRKGAGT